MPYSALLFIFTTLCASLVGGYTCGHLLKYFNVQKWNHVCVCACFSCTIAFFFFFVPASFTRAKPEYPASSSSHPLEGIIPFTLVMFIVIAVPSIFGGAFLAFRQQPLANPVSIGKIVRAIPVQPYYLRSSFLIFVCAFPPLIAIDIFPAVWHGLFDEPPLSIMLVVWATSVALTSVIMVYCMLCHGNHQWWWTAFAAPGGLGAPLCAYAVFDNDPQTDFIRLGLFLVAYALVAGSIGVLSALLFVHNMYSSVTLLDEKAELDNTFCLLDRNAVDNVSS